MDPNIEEKTDEARSRAAAGYDAYVEYWRTRAVEAEATLVLIAMRAGLGHDEMHDELEKGAALVPSWRAYGYRDDIIEECAKTAETQVPGTRYAWINDSMFGNLVRDIAKQVRALKHHNAKMRDGQ